MDQEQAIELARQYKALVAEHLPLRAMFLYGSYSKGGYTDESDIDIAVVLDQLSANYFDDTPLLWRLRRQVSTLIEPVILTPDDNNPLYHDVCSTGIMI
ncbi:MAG: nucleotidyltransferase domain-containing protein [Bacteroidales bacterium]|nr:nucleotidyltransferase domain-containing protein [Bacteroidales bacterium]